MENAKKVKKYATNAIKKVPKKEIITKATTYGLSQVIPYYSVWSFLAKKGKKKIIKYASTYIYENALRSKYTIEKLNTIPLSLISMGLRGIFNFLLFSKLLTGIHWLDFFISMFVTIFVTVLSPFFYTAVKSCEPQITKYTNIFIDNFLGPNGWEYLDAIKNIILLSLGVLLIIVLQFVEVDSRYLQELIVHTLITGYVSDKILIYLSELTRKRIFYIGIFYTDEPQYIVPVIFPAKEVKVCNTKNRVFVELKPCKDCNIVSFKKYSN